MNKIVEQFKTLVGKETVSTSPSPFGGWLNFTLLEVEEGFLKAEILLRPEFGNPGGILHGGVISGIIDEAMGMCTFTLARENFYVAVNLNIDFLRPGILGETLTITTEIIRAGKSMVHGECKLHNKDGKLIAKAASNLAMVNR